MSGISSASARAFAAVSPTTRAPTSPGRVATATAPRSASETPARPQGLVDHRQDLADMLARRDLRHHAPIALVQRRPARQRRWSESAAPPVRGGRGPSSTAAAVSSHVVSMARKIKVAIG